MQDVAVQSKEFEGSLIGFTQYFKCTDAKHGKLAMPESMVTSEREDAAQHLKQKRNISNGGISVDAHAHEHPHEDVPAEDKFLKAALPTGKIDRYQQICLLV